MKKSVLKLTVGIAVFAATSAITQAQTATTTTAAPAAPAVSVAATPAPPPPTAYDKWEEGVKNPVDWFSWGGDMRVRNEYFNNALSLGSGPGSGPFGPCMNRTISVFVAGLGPAFSRQYIRALQTT